MTSEGRSPSSEQTHYMGCECQECMPGIGADAGRSLSSTEEAAMSGDSHG